MNTLVESLVQFELEYGHLIKPVIVGTLVSIVCSVVGCFIILRRMSFLADAIAHSMLSGVIAGYLVMKLLFGVEADLAGMLIGAALAGILTVALIGFVTRVSRIKEDTAIGIMYTGIFAAGAFAISIKSISQEVHIDIYHFVVGSVLAVSDAELWLIAIVASIVLSTVLLLYRSLQITSFDPVMAASIGVPVLLIDYALTACTSLVVISGVRVAGVILVVALIITPAAAAFLLTDRLNRMIITASVISAVGYWLGFAGSIWFGSSPGAAVVVAMTAIFLLTLIAAPRYGLLHNWIRRMRAVPQEIKEDVLGAIWRSEGKLLDTESLVASVSFAKRKVRRAVRLLLRQNLLQQQGGDIGLTAEGGREAQRLVRAHRLWETYLTKTGTPLDQVHQQAHRLEHISDETTVEYLDDRLGHPITDPHGTEIPESFDKLEIRGTKIKASLLRAGDKAIVCEVHENAEPTGIAVDMIVTAHERSVDGQFWKLESDGQTFQLNHSQADAVVVVLE